MARRSRVGPARSSPRRSSRRVAVPPVDLPEIRLRATAVDVRRRPFDLLAEPLRRNLAIPDPADGVPATAPRLQDVLRRERSTRRLDQPGRRTGGRTRRCPRRRSPRPLRDVGAVVPRRRPAHDGSRMGHIHMVLRISPYSQPTTVRTFRDENGDRSSTARGPSRDLTAAAAARPRRAVGPPGRRSFRGVTRRIRVDVMKAR